MNFEFIAKHWKFVLYLLGGMGLIYALIWIFTFKPQIPLEYKHTLDSLDRSNADLIARQNRIDSSIALYQDHIDSLDLVISNLDIRKTEIHNHYHNLGKKAETYTATQIDSFFKVRYDY